MVETSSARPERRRFFRLDTDLPLAIEALTAAEAAAYQSPAIAKQGLKGGLDGRISTLLELMRNQNAIAAELFDLLNKKINLMRRELQLDEGQAELPELSRHRINLSACGAGLRWSEQFDEDQFVLLHMELLSIGVVLSCLAKVISCDEEPNVGDPSLGHYFLRLDFCQIDEADQESLIHFLMQEQSRALKLQRESSGPR